MPHAPRPTADSHREAAAADRAAIRCAIVTISDTRTPETDESGDIIERLIRAADHEVAVRDLVADEPPIIDERLRTHLADPRVALVLMTGGTGLGRRDTTIEVVERHLTARLDGFGELFRSLSYEQMGSAAMLSRAVGGLVARDEAAGGDTFVFAMPGSPHAVELAMTTLIVPEVGHLVWGRRG